MVPAQTGGVPFDALLQAHIDRTGITAAALSKRLGVSEATVSRYRSGQDVPSDRHIPVLMDVLGITEEEVARALRFSRRARDSRKGPAASGTELKAQIAELKKEIAELRELVLEMLPDTNQGERG